MEDPATVKALLSRHVDFDKVEVLRRLVYTFNALVAERWRKGRMLLAGDAAHMTPQFMGQGMSSGVRDAHNLAWKLEAVVRGGGSESLMDTYESERKPHAKEMIDISVRMKNFVSMANPFKAWLRNVAVKTLLKTPKVGDYLREARFKPPPTYPQGAYLGLPRRRRKSPEGRPIPQPQVRTFAGRRALLDEILGEGFALVGHAVDPRSRLDAKSLAGLSAIGARFVALYPYGGRPQGQDLQGVRAEGLVEVEDLSGEGVAWFRASGAKPGSVALIRPDKFVYGVVPAASAAEVVSHALRALYGERPKGERSGLGWAGAQGDKPASVSGACVALAEERA
jgi:3-(3-hydroxy-phenyl)propionate hydroxylase